MLSIPPAADTDTIDSVRCTLSLLLLHLAAFCPGIEEWRGRECARARPRAVARLSIFDFADCFCLACALRERSPAPRARPPARPKTGMMQMMASKGGWD